MTETDIADQAGLVNQGELNAEMAEDMPEKLPLPLSCMVYPALAKWLSKYFFNWPDNFGKNEDFFMD